jgi:hypothetical protein
MPPKPEPRASVRWDQVLALRLERQHLVKRTTPDRMVDVVHELIGVHAQVMSGAELQLAARIDGLRPDDIRDAIWDRRRLVKAWAMRGTLHLLTPDDLMAFVDASAAHERWHDPVWLRYFDMTEKQVEGMIAAAAALLSEQPMTRADLADGIARRLRRPKLAETLRSGWGTFLGGPARRGHLVFGPSEGRNVRFVKSSAWLGRPIAATERKKVAEPLDALGGLIRRHLAVFPAASREMIGRWWGALRGSLISNAIKRIDPAELAEVDVGGLRAWALAGDIRALETAERFRGVRLLPGFDPFTNELPRKTAAVLPVIHHDRVYRTAGWITPLVIVDGRIGGTWEIGGGKKGVVQVVPFGRWRGGTRKELAGEVDRIAAFLDRPLGLEVEAPAR